jgi:hypothetical protein
VAIDRKGREQSGEKRVRERPSKPYPDFPLFPHATGRWAKKIRGRFAFFGPWEDPMGALDRYLAQRDDLYAGRVPRPNPPGETAPAGPSPATNRNGSASNPTVRDLVNHFLTAKQRRIESGEMGQRAFSDYHAACPSSNTHRVASGRSDSNSAASSRGKAIVSGVVVVPPIAAMPSLHQWYWRNSLMAIADSPRPAHGTLERSPSRSRLGPFHEGRAGKTDRQG